ncbi:MAG: hypothetical protein JXR20_04625 [Balneola sp.]
MSNISKLLVDQIKMVDKKDGTGEFPVVLITGITFSVSESGNSSFTKRRVSIPLNNLSSMKEAEEYFTEGTVLEGFELYKKPCEEYEYEAPTGETYLLDYKWAICKAGEQERTAKKVVRTMDKEIFSTANKKTNNLQPQD